MASWMDNLLGLKDKALSKFDTFMEPQEMTLAEYREWLKRKRFNPMYNVYKETVPWTSSPADKWGDAYASYGSYPGDPGHGTVDERVPKPGVGAKPAEKYFKEMDRMFLASMLGSAFGGKKKTTTFAPAPSKSQPKPGDFKLKIPPPIPKKQEPFEWNL